MPKEIRNRRNNVEASIFHLCHRAGNNKTRYRGKFKTKLWAVCRCIWINLVGVYLYAKKPPKLAMVPA